jgi:quercetin dioxygenase-like cupin family protein
VAGTARCQIEHIGIVLSGRAKVLMDTGREYELTPGDVFHVPAGHDSWVVGDEPYVSLHLLGAGDYAR